MRWDVTTDRRPYSVNLEVTLACNLRCKHCGASAGRARRDELTLEEWRACFRDLARLGCEEACLLGGELLVRNDWEGLCRGVGDAGLGLVIITNGWSVDSGVVSTLADLSVNRIGVSLDAATPAVHDEIRGREGSHARALAALYALRDAGLETGAITTLSRDNLLELPKLRDLFVGQDITWQIQTAALGGERFEGDRRLDPREFHDVGRFIAECRAAHSVDELPVAGSHDLGYHSAVFGHVGELREWSGCGAGLYTLGITSDGHVKGCLSQHEDFIEGNIRDRPLEDLWNDPALFLRNRRFIPEQLKGFCKVCPHGSTCRAGCSNVAYTSTGRLYDNPFCFYRIEEEGA